MGLYKAFENFCDIMKTEVTTIEEIIKKIVRQKKSLLGNNPQVSKINIGFTNTLYNVDDKYIIKVCTDETNEDKFKKEINFYNSNKDNTLIPKLYISNTDKNDVPYMYEILEKIDGVSLYDVWYKLDESEREEIIKQLCEAMKKFHSNKGKTYDWAKRTSDLFVGLYEKAKQSKIFSDEELIELNDAYLKFPELLKSDEFVLVHNDLHFDNIFYKNGKIKLIDFERSLYAPKDFELDILYRMIRKPWKFASEENEQYTKLSDYENIMNYIEKYYPELIHIDNLYKRLAIYDIVYFLNQYINAPQYDELKQDVLKAVEIVTTEKQK